MEAHNSTKSFFGLDAVLSILDACLYRRSISCGGTNMAAARNPTA